MRALCRLISLAAVAGCSAPFSPEKVCTLELRTSIGVVITDAVTGLPAPVGATVIVRGGAFYDSVLVFAPLFSASLGYLTWENLTPPGRYSVQVRKPGYLNFIKNDVDVVSDGCHNGPGPTVNAALQPKP